MRTTAVRVTFLLVLDGCEVSVTLFYMVYLLGNKHAISYAIDGLFSAASGRIPGFYNAVVIDPTAYLQWGSCIISQVSVLLWYL